MAAKRSAEKIRVRFLAEQGHIERYMGFLDRKACIEDGRIVRLSIMLQRQGFGRLRYRSLRQMMNCFPGLSHKQLLDLGRDIDAIEPQVREALASGQALVKTRPYATLPEDDFQAHELACDNADWAESELLIRERLSDEVIARVEARIRAKVAAEVAMARSGASPEACLLVGGDWSGFSDDVVEQIIQAAIEFWLTERVEGLEAILEEFEEVRVSTRAAAPDAEINIHRQGFILLMTAFDAAVFDLVRVALRHNFFSLAGAFAKDEKMSMSEIAGAGSFEGLRDRIIEEQLKQRYVKDLLRLLRKWGVDLVDPAGGEKPERLFEMVLRRNLHVHNRGVVDKRYAEGENLDGLKLGKVAVIDPAYLETANKLCKECVERVTVWAAR